MSQYKEHLLSKDKVRFETVANYGSIFIGPFEYEFIRNGQNDDGQPTYTLSTLDAFMKCTKPMTKAELIDWVYSRLFRQFELLNTVFKSLGKSTTKYKAVQQVQQSIVEPVESVHQLIGAVNINVPADMPIHKATATISSKRLQIKQDAISQEAIDTILETAKTFYKFKVFERTKEFTRIRDTIMIYCRLQMQMSLANISLVLDMHPTYISTRLRKLKDYALIKDATYIKSLCASNPFGLNESYVLEQFRNKNVIEE